MSERLLTTLEIAEFLQVLPVTVRVWLQRDKLRGLKLPAGDWRVHPKDLEQMLGRSRTGSG